MTVLAVYGCARGLVSYKNVRLTAESGAGIKKIGARSLVSSLELVRCHELISAGAYNCGFIRGNESN